MKSKANLMEELQQQGLISFEEITDYSIIQETVVSTKIGIRFGWSLQVTF